MDNLSKYRLCNLHDWKCLVCDSIWWKWWMMAEEHSYVSVRRYELNVGYIVVYDAGTNTR
jgi:hypothetical protein